MGFFKDIFKARQYRNKESVTPDEFLEALRCDYGRDIDPASTLFFRHHLITVNLVNKILAGRLKKSGDNKKDDLVIKALLSDMIEYTPNVASLNLNSPNIMPEIITEFSKNYKDAGNIVGKALVVFLGLS